MPCVREVLTMQKLEQLIDKNFAETAHGKVANYIPILEIVDPQQLGIAIYDVDEDEIGIAGMAGTRFAIESIAKVITLILAIKRLGHKRVLAELENGSADYSLSSVLLDDELTEQVHRVNYLNNSSALLTTALIDQLMGQNSFNALLGFCREICNDPCISLNERLFRSAIMNDKDIHALAYYMKDKDVEKANWKVVFSNCDQRWEFPNHTGKVICDSDDMSTWISLWDGAVVGSGEDDYDYENSSSNNCHMFWKRRDIPDMVIVVELGEPVVAGKIGITKANYDFPWNHDLKDCEFYMGKSFEFKPMQEGGSWRNYQTCNDGNKWNLVLTATDVPKEIGTFWYEVPEGTSISARTGKYIKIRPTAGWRGAPQTRRQGC